MIARLRAHRLARLLIVLVSGLFLGCPRALPPELSGAGTPLALDDPRVEAVLAAHVERSSLYEGLRGMAKVMLEAPEFRLNRPQRIAVARDARLRFEVLGLFDVVAGLLITDGVEFGVFDAGSGDWQRGRLDPELLWRWTQLDLEVARAVELLMAAPRPAADWSRAGVWLEPGAGLRVAFATAAGAAEVFRFGASGELASLESFEASGETRFEVRFDDYREVAAAEGRARFPMRITLRSPRTDSSARFDWKQVQLAESLPDALFAVPAPPSGG